MMGPDPVKLSQDSASIAAGAALNGDPALVSSKNSFGS
ncbi:hypothetical protein NOVOSPHI9U_310072 [Novosphingobium sp. 9U]|nr:hypothetical protein NOVOSPHI9U_310072 [Novosphingobium sp. 9U]